MTGLVNAFRREVDISRAQAEQQGPISSRAAAGDRLLDRRQRSRAHAADAFESVGCGAVTTCATPHAISTPQRNHITTLSNNLGDYHGLCR